MRTWITIQPTPTLRNERTSPSEDTVAVSLAWHPQYLSMPIAPCWEYHFPGGLRTVPWRLIDTVGTSHDALSNDPASRTYMT